MSQFITRLAAAAALLSAGGAARADFIVSVTAENVSPARSTSFAPLRVGFGNGTFDAFDNLAVATAPIISIAEGGSGSDWFPAFRAAEPGAVLGTVGGVLQPGQSATSTFTVDPAANPFFTFAAMVVPSNDLFIGNDAPIRLFDAAGNFAPRVINQFGRSIWDAGSEALDPANAAFVVGGVNDRRTPEGDVVRFDFDELNGFNGLTTAGGYVFDRQINGDTAVFRITVTATPVVPAPASALLLGFGAAGLAVRRVVGLVRG